MEVDSVHNLIEWKLKNQSIHLLCDYVYQVLRNWSA